mgnify:CR=1 FL=1
MFTVHQQNERQQIMMARFVTATDWIQCLSQSLLSNAYISMQYHTGILYFNTLLFLKLVCFL